MTTPAFARYAIAILLLWCIGWPAAAQQARLPRVGILANTIPTADLIAGTSKHPAPRMLVDGLRELGWVHGKNVDLVWRSAENDYKRLPALARELAAKSDVLVGFGPGVTALIEATSDVPIVMATSGTPGREVVNGVVRIESLARPGGNVTGLTLVPGNEINAKRLALMKEAAPAISRVAILGHSLPHASGVVGPRTRAAEAALGITLSAYSFESEVSRLETAFAEMARDRIDAVFVLELPATNLAPVQLAIHRLAERYRMVVMHEVLAAVDNGGLMSYSPDINKLYRRAPHYIDRILRGTKPGDIPIEQPVDFELRLNLAAARAIGLQLPQSLVVQAARIVQ